MVMLSSMACNVVTVNVRSILDRNRRSKMFSDILDTLLLPAGRNACQLFCLQETWLPSECVDDAAADWRAAAGDGAWAVFSPVDANDRCAGTAILYAPRLATNDMQLVTLIKAECGLSGRVCAANVRWHNSVIWLVSAYAPAGHPAAARANFFHDLDVFMTDARIDDAVAVSYTHLTLPTKRIV